MHNIHTHQADSQSECVEILNRLLAEGAPDNPLQPFSIGLHPWYIDKHPNWQQELPEILENLYQNPSLKAIGECGLDKNTAISLDLQTSVLNLHCDLALHYKKPLLIHCAGAFNELIVWKKTKRNAPLMLIHGFEKKLLLLNDLVKAGFYVSFGAALCKNRPTLWEAFRRMPLDSLFLETDDQKDFSIRDIYMAAAELKNIDFERLENQINANFEVFFNTTG